jgi:hypothetical protein
LYICDVVVEPSEGLGYMYAENGCLCSFCCGDIYMVIMIFSVNEVNTKVVDNSLILVVLKFCDFRTTGLRVMDFTISLSGFAYSLCSDGLLYLLTKITCESPLDVNQVVAFLFIRFLKY